MQLREKIFLILASVFVTSLVMANIIGITKFFEFTVPIWGHTVMVPVGIIPYPVTFLATDLICELYGRRRANFLVMVGFLMNVFLISICGLGQGLETSTAWVATLPTEWNSDVYPLLWDYIRIGIFGSMAAYLVAQFVDVQLFHFWKRLTKGRHLWLRNNASTMLSQLVDTSIIIAIIFGASATSGELVRSNPFGAGSVTGYAALGVAIFDSYIFKAFFALFDTPLAYIFKHLLKPAVGGLDEGETVYEND